MALRQKVLILYLADSSPESNVVAWAEYDGTGEKTHTSGDADEPPYPTGLDALRGRGEKHRYPKNRCAGHFRFMELKWVCVAIWVEASDVLAS